MNPSIGAFVWYELMTTDADAARRFYQATVGWQAENAGVAGIDYTLLSSAVQPVAGLMALPEDACAAGARPGWLGYIGVDDVDVTADRIKALGGAVHKAPEDIPGIGRFAVVADPQGAVFALFRGAGDGAMPAVTPGTPGHIGWHELLAADWATVFPFYATMFGWTMAEAIDMGPMGTYQLFAHGGTTIGGMMSKPPEMPAPAWNYYINVETIDAATDRVRANGGQVVFGPMQVPGGTWIINAIDPQGAFFALDAPPAA